MLRIPVRLAFLVDHPDWQIGVGFQPFAQHDLDEVRPAHVHFSSYGVQGRLQRSGPAAPQRRSGASRLRAEGLLEIWARQIAM